MVAYGVFDYRIRIQFQGESHFWFTSMTGRQVGKFICQTVKKQQNDRLTEDPKVISAGRPLTHENQYY